MTDPTLLARARGGAKSGVVILSENPIHDTGGGQRSAQLTRELLRRDHAVLFVSRGRVTETVDLEPSHEHPRLVEAPLGRVVRGGPEALAGFLSAGPAAVITQVAVKPWLPVLEGARGAGAVTVYDCVDRWDNEMGRGWYSQDVERSVAGASDVLTASSPALVEHVEGLAEREAHLIANAFDATVFDVDRAYHRPSDLSTGEQVVLFVGSLWGEWLDWSLVDEIARTLPDTAFVFIGDHRREGRGLPANCTFLGLKAQVDLPAYLAHADVAILPWHLSETTDAVSPLTVYEHIAMGLPVVARPIDPLRDVPGVRLVNDTAEFVEAVRTTSRSSLSSDERERMRRFAGANSWSVRADQMLALIADARERLATSRRLGAPAVPAARGPMSVVIPSYNHERFIGEAVDSVRRQTLPPQDLVVVDDGSTDRSLDVLDRHRFEGMRVIAQKNRGAHAAINRAIARSRGEWVAILNSDDAFDPERLEYVWSAARSRRAALVIGSVTLVDPEGRPLAATHETSRWYSHAQRHAAHAKTFAAAARRENVAMTTSNFFLHRELWRRLGGFRSYRYVHDYDFLLRALELCPEAVLYAPELSGVRYRIHEANTIAENVDRALAERAEMLRHLSRPVRRLRALLERGPARRSVKEAAARAVAWPPAVVAVDGSREALRVGLVARSLDFGGLEEVVALLAQGLRGRGFRPTVLCTQSGGEVADRLRNAEVPVTVASGSPSAWARWIEEAEPDVLSTHFAEPGFVEAIHERAPPVVETVHNTYAWLNEPDWALEGDKAKRCARLVAVSELAARYYVSRTNPGREPAVIPNAVDPGRAARLPRSLARQWLELGDDEVVFVHLGRLTPQKNLPGLLRAFQRFMAGSPGARLLLVGPDEDGLLARLRREFRGLFRDGSVRHVQPVRAVGSVLSAADALVSNSLYEGWSMSASEALWVGIPVILSNAGSAARLVGVDGARGYLVPNALGDPMSASPTSVADPPTESVRRNRDALTEAFAALVSARAAWMDRAGEIRDFARDDLSVDRMISSYADILRTSALRHAPA